MLKTCFSEFEIVLRRESWFLQHVVLAGKHMIASLMSSFLAGWPKWLGAACAFLSPFIGSYNPGPLFLHMASLYMDSLDGYWFPCDWNLNKLKAWAQKF